MADTIMFDMFHKVWDKQPQMQLTRKRRPRAKPLDLDRRAAALGCSVGHLSMVLNSKRESRSLMARLAALIASESRPAPKPQ